MTSTRFLRACLVAATAITLTAHTSGAQTTGACAGHGNCAEVTTFVAAVTDFRTSQRDRGVRLATATVRFLNKTTRPLVLGYVQKSGIVTDDQGNRFEVYGADAVRGIGEVSASSFDPKFALQPGEASDARFEFAFQMPNANTILGTRYEIELTVREIDAVTGTQYRLGRERALRFSGFTSGNVASAAGSPVTTGASPSSAAAAPTVSDPCGVKPRCYGAGPFVAEVQQLTASMEGNRYHVLRENVTFRNLTDEPLILAYKARSNAVIDNLGNRYYWGRPSSYDMSATGIGKVEGSKADPQFTLRPGESRTATFSVIRYDAGGHELGTSFTQDLVISQLELLPSGQIRVARDYSVSFKELRPGATDEARAKVNDAGKKLIDAIRGRVRKNP